MKGEPSEAKHLITSEVEETTLIAEDVAADASSIKPGEGLDVEAVASTEIVIMDVDTTTLEVEVAAVITVDVMDEDIMIVDLIEAEEPIIT